MFVVDAIPFRTIKAKQSQVFSYFSDKPVNVGSIVEIKIRTKNAPALVINVQDLSKNKALIKKLSFTLKPINKILAQEPIFSQKQIELAKFISEYYFSPLSQTFKKSFLFPKSFYSNLSSPNEIKSSLGKSSYFYTDKFEKLNSLVKKTRGQVLILVPDSFWQSFVSEKLRLNHLIFSKSGRIKKIKEKYQEILENKTKIILAKKEGLFLPFPALGLIVVFDEQNPLYKSWQKPLFHAKKVAEELARLHGADVLYFSSPCYLETYFGVQSGLIKTL